MTRKKNWASRPYYSSPTKPHTELHLYSIYRQEPLKHRNLSFKHILSHIITHSSNFCSYVAHLKISLNCISVRILFFDSFDAQQQLWQKWNNFHSTKCVKSIDCFISTIFDWCEMLNTKIIRVRIIQYVCVMGYSILHTVKAFSLIP